MKKEAPISRTEYRVSRRTKHYGVFSCERCGLGIDGIYILLSYAGELEKPNSKRAAERYHEECFKRFRSERSESVR